MRLWILDMDVLAR